LNDEEKMNELNEKGLDDTYMMIVKKYVEGRLGIDESYLTCNFIF